MRVTAIILSACVALVVSGGVVCANENNGSKTGKIPLTTNPQNQPENPNGKKPQPNSNNSKNNIDTDVPQDKKSKPEDKKKK